MALPPPLSARHIQRTMTAGMYIVVVCAVGGLIAGAAFWWAVRSGQLTDASEAKYLVFDDEDEVERPVPAQDEAGQEHPGPTDPGRP